MRMSVSSGPAETFARRDRGPGRASIDLPVIAISLPIPSGRELSGSVGLATAVETVGKRTEGIPEQLSFFHGELSGNDSKSASESRYNFPQC